MKAPLVSSPPLRGAHATLLAAPRNRTGSLLRLHTPLSSRESLLGALKTARAKDLCLRGKASGTAAAGAHRHQRVRASVEGETSTSSSRPTSTVALKPALSQDESLELRKGSFSTEAAPGSGAADNSTQAPPEGAAESCEPQCMNGEDAQEGSGAAPGRLSSSNLPPRFLDFLRINGIDPSLYVAAATVPRHVRIRPLDGSQPQGRTQQGPLQEDQATQQSETQRPAESSFTGLTPSASDVAAVEADLGIPLEPLPWLPGFFSLPPEHPIAGSRSYKTGRIFGMDAASGAAVAALGIQEGDHVLDLCAAPGAKLTMMADSLGEGSGTLTAVDVSLPRLAATKTVLVKYKAADRCRLFLGDATRFAFPPPLPNLDAQRRGPRTRDSTPQPSDQAAQRRGSDVTGECRECYQESSGGPMEEATTGQAPQVLGMLTEEYGVRLTLEDMPDSEEGSTQRRSDAGLSTADSAVASPVSPAAATAQSPVESPSDGASAEPCQRRKKTRKERRRARKLRQFTAYLPEATSTLSLPSTVGVLPEGSVEGGVPSLEGERQHVQVGGTRQGQLQHPELYFVGRKGWQWWDPSRDAHEPASPSQAPLEPGLAGVSGPSRLYDKVLVDAECTHDGSVKHVLKFEEWGWETLDRRFMDDTRLSQLGQLQRGLLETGFALLKPGGKLVYSTCSLTRAQNEDVVEGFLASHADATVLPVPGASKWPCKAGGVLHTIRFDPVTSKTGGLFIALMTKK